MSSDKAARLASRIQTSRECATDGCSRLARHNHTYCMDCIHEQQARQEARRRGNFVVKRGSKLVEFNPRGKEANGFKGGNVEAVENLEEWLKHADKQALKRFGAQIEFAKTLAAELDEGDLKSATAYNTLIKNIYERVDRIYGTENIDIVARMSNMVAENAKKRAEQGWS